MFEQISLAFLEILVSVETLIFLAGYLVLCNSLVSHASELVFSLAVESFWAICFSYLFCRVFFADTHLFHSVESSWPWIFGALLVLAILPALATRALTRKPGFPPLLGLLHTIWLVVVSNFVLWTQGLLIIPPLEILLAIAFAAIVTTTVIGFVLVGIAAVASSEKAHYTYTRIAGMFTSYIPICLYGASIKGIESW